MKRLVQKYLLFLVALVLRIVYNQIENGLQSNLQQDLSPKNEKNNLQ